MAALDHGNEDAFRNASVNERVAQTLATASREGWGSWKTRAVCKYITKCFESMTVAELSTINDDAADELITHASRGFDAHARRRMA